MYERAFELTRRPFLGTPDTTAYFPSSGHEEVLALLKIFLKEGDGIGVLVGGPGSGKTLLCHLLLEQLDAACAPVFITNPHSPSVAALLQAILYDLSLPYEGAGEQELRLRVTDQLIERFRGGTRTVLFVDEAQHLSVEQIEELRLLTNLESRRDRALQVLLVGQEKLAETLADSRLAGLRQRVAVYARLSPLSAEETVEYVRALVSKAGGAADAIFTAAAFSDLYELSLGVPRRINQLCHRALYLAYSHESGTVDAREIQEAARQLCPLEAAAAVAAPAGVPRVAPVSEPDAAEPAVVEVGAGLPSGRSRSAGPSRGHFAESPTIIEPEPAPMVRGPAGRAGNPSRFRQLYAS